MGLNGCLCKGKVGFGKERREWRSGCQLVRAVICAGWLARDELKPEVGF